jgi:hypothetical protein
MRTVLQALTYPLAASPTARLAACHAAAVVQEAEAAAARASRPLPPPAWWARDGVGGAGRRLVVVGYLADFLGEDALNGLLSDVIRRHRQQRFRRGPAEKGGEGGRESMKQPAIFRRALGWAGSPKGSPMVHTDHK